MSIRISIRKNWKPPLLKVRAMKKPVRALDWWLATKLVMVQQAQVSKQVNAVFSSNSTVTDTFLWNSSSLAKLDIQFSKIVAGTYTSVTTTSETDPFWIVTRGVKTDVQFVKAIDAVYLFDQEIPPENNWFKATTATILPVTVTNRPTTATLVQNQPTPADNNWWDETTAAVAGKTVNRPTDATLVQNQPTPADNNWWDETTAIIVGQTVNRPTTATLVQDQPTPADINWWDETTATTLPNTQVARPTQAVYYQTNPTPADIGWWAFAGV